MGREEILKVFADFIFERTMKRIYGEFYQNIIEEMKEKKDRDERLDVLISNIFAGTLVTLEQFQKISQKELFRWEDDNILRFRKPFHAHTPKKIINDKDAIKRVIYFILDEFIEDKVMEELNEWAKAGAQLAKLEAIINILGMSGNN